MREAIRMKPSAVFALMAIVTVCCGSAQGQSNPYQVVENWVRPPGARAWKDPSAVDIDREGNLWLVERCGADTCVNSDMPAVLVFNSSGKLLKSFGDRMFVYAHGIFI